MENKRVVISGERMGQHKGEEVELLLYPTTGYKTGSRMWEYIGVGCIQGCGNTIQKIQSILHNNCKWKVTLKNFIKRKNF